VPAMNSCLQRPPKTSGALPSWGHRERRKALSPPVGGGKETLRRGTGIKNAVPAVQKAKAAGRATNQSSFQRYRRIGVMTTLGSKLPSPHLRCLHASAPFPSRDVIAESFHFLGIGVPCLSSLEGALTPAREIVGRTPPCLLRNEDGKRSRLGSDFLSPFEFPSS
jgi:hypothetical protein